MDNYLNTKVLNSIDPQMFLYVPVYWGAYRMLNELLSELFLKAGLFRMEFR